MTAPAHRDIDDKAFDSTAKSSLSTAHMKALEEELLYDANERLGFCSVGYQQYDAGQSATMPRIATLGWACLGPFPLYVPATAAISGSTVTINVMMRYEVETFDVRCRPFSLTLSRPTAAWLDDETESGTYNLAVGAGQAVLPVEVIVGRWNRIYLAVRCERDTTTNTEEQTIEVARRHNVIVGTDGIVGPSSDTIPEQFVFIVSTAWLTPEEYVATLPYTEGFTAVYKSSTPYTYFDRDPIGLTGEDMIFVSGDLGVLEIENIGFDLTQAHTMEDVRFFQRWRYKQLTSAAATRRVMTDVTAAHKARMPQLMVGAQMQEPSKLYPGLWRMDGVTDWNDFSNNVQPWVSRDTVFRCALFDEQDFVSSGDVKTVEAVFGIYGRVLITSPLDLDIYLAVYDTAGVEQASTAAHRISFEHVLHRPRGGYGYMNNFDRNTHQVLRWRSTRPRFSTWGYDGLEHLDEVGMSWRWVALQLDVSGVSFTANTPYDIKIEAQFDTTLVTSPSKEVPIIVFSNPGIRLLTGST